MNHFGRALRNIWLGFWKDFDINQWILKGFSLSLEGYGNLMDLGRIQASRDHETDSLHFTLV